MAWYLRWRSHKCTLAQDPWVTCSETFMKSFSELLSLDRHSSLSPSTRKLKLQDMCLCLVLWPKEKEKLWGLVASSGHHSCCNQKGNPVLIVSTLSYLKAFVMVATSAAKGPNSELWINEGEKKWKIFFQWFGTVRGPFLELEADQAFSQHLPCLYLTSTLRLDAAGVQLQSARGGQWWSSLVGEESLPSASFPSLLLVLTFQNSLRAALLLYLAREEALCRALHP